MAESVNKLSFASDELHTKAKIILQLGVDEPYHHNALQLKRIAHAAAHRRSYAADMAKELMHDNELRFDESDKELRPMHLQTAYMRMRAHRAKNWDLYAVSTLGLSAIL